MRIERKHSKRRKAPGTRNKCPTGKVCFRDKEEASTALQNTRRSGAVRRREKRYYRCTECQFWHLTSQPEPASL